MSQLRAESRGATLLASNARCLYLDTSFFIGLEKNFSLRSDAVRQLRALTEVIPLCLSFITVVELARGMSSSSLQQMARFIDSLKPCWLRSECEIERQEVLSYLKSPDDGPFGAANPFDSYIYGILKEELCWHEIHDLVTGSMNLEAFLSGFQGSERGRNLMNTFCQNGGYYMGKLREDREQTRREGAGRNDIRSITQTKAIGYLHSRVAQEFSEQLSEGNAAIKLPQSRGLFIPDASLLSPIRGNDIVKFPSFFIAREFLNGRASAFPDVNSVKFSETRSSEAGDYFHTFAAAYCDFFSCDGRAAPIISDARARYGLRKPLVMDASGPSGLLEKVERAL